MTEERPQYDVEAARRVLEEDRRRREEECRRLIEEALAVTNCQLVAVVVVGGREVPVPVMIVAM